MLNKTNITDAAILMVALINPIPANWKKLPCIFGISSKKTIKNAIENDENIFKIKNVNIIFLSFLTSSTFFNFAIEIINNIKVVRPKPPDG